MNQSQGEAILLSQYEEGSSIRGKIWNDHFKVRDLGQIILREHISMWNGWRLAWIENLRVAFEGVGLSRLELDAVIMARGAPTGIHGTNIEWNGIINKLDAELSALRQIIMDTRSRQTMKASSPITVHASGGSRVNIQSVDNSTNVNSVVDLSIFQEFTHAVQNTMLPDQVKQSLLSAVEALKEAKTNKQGFAERYQALMAVLADHLAVYGPVFAPLISRLAQAS